MQEVKRGMSLQECQSGTTTGFPITLSQNLYSKWPATDAADADRQMQQLIVPTDFTVQWGPPASSAQISVRHTPDMFQISGFNTVSDNTTLTYGSATYTCSEVLSIVQNQHKNLCYDSKSQYEVILAFQINNKALNPSSPDVILLSRPIIFTTTPNTTTFWTAVNKAAKTKSAQRTAFDMSQIYGYSQKVLMPMISYQSCIPVKIVNYKNTRYQLGSLSIRVHVIPQAVYVMADDSGTGLCSSVSKYTLITSPKRPIDLFQDAAYGSTFQFQDGLGPGGFPSGVNENLVPLGASSQITAFQKVTQLLEILVPEDFLGKSLAQIAESNTHVAKPKKKKAFKCYRINPETDIKDNEILIDPTTGEPLADTLKKKAYDDSGGDPALLDIDTNVNVNDPGIMPGDIQTMLTSLLIFAGTIVVLAYLGFIMHTLFYRINGFHTALYHIFIFFIVIGVLSSMTYYLNT